MTFPRQDNSAPSRGRAAACEADNFAAVMQLPAFLKTHGPRSLKDWMNYGICASQSCEIPAVSFRERKAGTDEIADVLGATSAWRDGYMAARQDAVLRTVIDFFPPILAADAEDAA